MDGVDFDKLVTGKLSLKIDVEHFEHLLDDPSLTRAQKHQILEALWAIIVAFVDLGFGVHLLQEVCGESGKDSTDFGNDLVDSAHSKKLITPPKNAGDGPPRERQDS